ncbi:MAG: cytidine deaminase [Desulfitobacteriaceae bacterium]|nr:cytidine deaminase [Desulfitobacteriaceae bacterium]MDD4346604.1 cytidine deaminase [Desulfitobacteriaceae bacterium]MDD4400360.1 cytidine deaminase [Desulfitobacteriaceae bacterium]
MPESKIIQELISQARQIAAYAYTPYSHYPVGAAAYFTSGKIYPGCNVENASYGLTICAERNAIFQAIAQGERQLVSLAIYVPQEVFASPCGACRQVMREFAADCSVILINQQGLTRNLKLAQLLPDSFGPGDLSKISDQVGK